MKIKIITQFVILLIIIPTFGTIAKTEKKENFEKFNYIIFTNYYLKKSVQSLIEWRENQGFKLKIITDMENSDEIRNFLKSKYLEWDIKYVLIVGSHRTIPMKECYIEKENEEGYYCLPTDHYYAELTHNWDQDNDGFYGEFDDDIKNNIDLLPEISVGRIPFDRPKNVKEFCKKLIKYEKDNGDWKTKALFLAGILEYIPQYIDSALFAEKLQNETFINNGFSCTKLYETGGLKPTNYTYDLPLKHRNVIKKLREGYGYVSIMGKGTYRTVRRYLWVEDNGNGVPDKNEIKLLPTYIFLHSFEKFLLKDDKPSVVYSFTCFTAHPKIMNLCSALLDSTAIIFIGPTKNNKGGWQLKYNFTKYFTSTDMRIGDSYTNAKEDYINSNGEIDNFFWFYDEESIRWTILNTGFYGDPATLKYLT